MEAERESPAILSRSRSAPESMAFAPRTPAGTVTLTDRPHLLWHPAPGVTRYRVTLYDITNGAAGARIVAETSEAGPTCDWQPPTRLSRGRTYEWEVRALREDREELAPPARFRVLDQATASRLARSADAALSLAIACAEAGLLDEAERTLQLALAARPDGPAAERLLRRLRALRSQRP
jgi:hypothetical protein